MRRRTGKKIIYLKATFEDFINGLYFYSEMEFKHKGKIYVVYFVHNTDENIICFESGKISQKYLTREDFKDKANYVRLTPSVRQAFLAKIFTPQFTPQK